MSLKLIRPGKKIVKHLYGIDVLQFFSPENILDGIDIPSKIFSIDNLIRLHIKLDHLPCSD